MLATVRGSGTSKKDGGSLTFVKQDSCLLDSDCLLDIVAEGWRRTRVL